MRFHTGIPVENVRALLRFLLHSEHNGVGYETSNLGWVLSFYGRSVHQGLVSESG